MAKGVISQDEVRQYHEDGFVLVRGMFSAEEIGLLGRAAHEDRIMDQQSSGRADGEGGTVRLSLWNHPTDTIYGAFARCKSIVGSAEKLLDDEVYHYHSKMIMKDAKIGGAWAWHQDYGYWYQNGVLFPDLTSVFIAVDRATKENGCLQVIKGSHKMGRVDHAHDGNQMGADMNYVHQALEMMEHVFVELDPGDVLVFHSNLFHRSEANLSDKSRWSFISAYNRVSNVPKLEKSTACITPMQIVPDDRLISEDVTHISEDADFLSVEKDVNIR